MITAWVPSRETRMMKISRTRRMDAERLRRLCGHAGSSTRLVRRVLIVRLLRQRHDEVLMEMNVDGR